MKPMVAVTTYLALALTVFSLAGCNTISSQIRNLNAESADVEADIRIQTDHVKSIMALVATLEQVKRDGGTAKSEHDVKVARERYATTKSKL